MTAMTDIADTPATAADRFSHVSTIRYIKLGEKGGWASEAFATGTIPFKYRNVPHAPCVAGDWEAVRRLLLASGSKNVGDDIRELRAFYELDDCLWITFADGHLWWAFSEGPVLPIDEAEDARPLRYRNTVDGWYRHSITGQALEVSALSSVLTRLASYRRTICRVEASAYLLRKLRGEAAPAAARAREQMAALEQALADLVPLLDWRDLEIVVDLIFSQGGWRRLSAVGTGETDLDLLLENPITGERAWVQVKSRADQAILDDALARFRRHGNGDRFVFICHSPRGALALTDDAGAGAQLWTGPQLVARIAAAGLADWLIARTG